jgi:proline iminopeptidase
VDYEEHFNRAGKKGALGGVSVLATTTSLGDFQARTKRTGNNPDVALLLLHGGPGATHEYFIGAEYDTMDPRNL